jgi:NADPH:quinone reductase-like Zn-dependent oxidoreductase
MAGATVSEYALLDHPVAKPAGVPWEEAAGMITVGEAAFRALAHLGLADEDRADQGPAKGRALAILGIAGSVGLITAQLAIARGHTVVGTADSADLDRVNGLGATAVRYGPGWAERVRAAAPGGADAVFDTAGVGLLADAVALVGDPARVITIADHHFAEHGVRFTGIDPADRFPEALPELAALIATKDLTVPIWRSYPLAEAAQAHADPDEHRNRGKIILIP